MAAGEDQPQPLVGNRRIVRQSRSGGLFVGGERGRHRREPRPPPQLVDGLVARRPVEPGARIAGRVRRPIGDRGGERVLQRFFGDVEVADRADQARQQPAPVRFVDLVDQLNVMIGRTSTEPKRAPGIFDAMWMASSMSFASTR